MLKPSARIVPGDITSPLGQWSSVERNSAKPGRDRRRSHVSDVRKKLRETAHTAVISLFTGRISRARDSFNAEVYLSTSGFLCSDPGLVLHRWLGRLSERLRGGPSQMRIGRPYCFAQRAYSSGRRIRDVYARGTPL
jgi:hypothetical protein